MYAKAIEEIALDMIDYYYEKAENSSITKSNFMGDPFIKWLRTEGNINPAGAKRNSKLIRILVIAMVQAGFSDIKFK